MWAFSGKYTGKAKEIIQNKKKKQAVGWSIFLFVIVAVIYTIMVFTLGEGNATYIAIILSGGALTILGIILVFFIDFRIAPKCDIKIKNDGFEVFQYGRWNSFVFYKISSLEMYDDFIVVENNAYLNVVLQKDLMIEGDWEELKLLLKKVEESLDSDEPMYQIEEPLTEFFNATVKSKRIFKSFVGVQMVRSTFEYLATFELENGQEVEYAIGQEYYQEIEEGQIGQLVLVNGNFFSFGEGEDIE